MQLDGGWHRTEAAMGFDTNLIKIFKKFNTKLGSLWAVRLKRFLNGSRLQKVCVGHKKLNLEGTQWHFVVQNFKLDEEKKGKINPR